MLPQTRYVELFIVVDKERVGLVTVFLPFQATQTRSEHPMKEIEYNIFVLIFLKCNLKTEMACSP